MFNLAQAFNGNIGNWNVSNVVDMGGMFSNATAFDQNLSNWCVENIQNEPEEFSVNSAISTSNMPVWGTCP